MMVEGEMSRFERWKEKGRKDVKIMVKKKIREGLKIIIRNCLII